MDYRRPFSGDAATEVERHRSVGILAVEMEAAALYAFAGATGNPVVCFAHVTNQMASVEGDFEKGAASGSTDALRVLGATGPGAGWPDPSVERRQRTMATDARNVGDKGKDLASRAIRPLVGLRARASARSACRDREPKGASTNDD